MLTAYRRHSAKCPHNAKGRDHKNCKCPIWADGVLGNREVRLSVKTRDWNEAARKILRMEAEGRTGGRVLLTTAWDSFLALKESDGVSASVIKKYKLLRRRLEEFTEPRRIEYVNDCSLAILTEFRVSWKWGLRTSAKHLERLKSFFAFCAARHWTAEGNPADKIKAPVGAKEICPTLPFTQAEMIKLLTACDTYEAEVGPSGFLNARRLRTLILVMRYTGLRIGDAVGLSADSVQGDKVFLYTAKTGTKVYTVIPAHVVAALAATPRVTDKLYFWSGNGKIETATKDYEGRVLRLLKLANVSKGKNFMVSHRFRDTFAVEYLSTGRPIERLSILLGHTSIKTTEKHYAPWVKSRQDQLEADIRAMWAHQEQGTKEVQKQNARPN